MAILVEREHIGIFGKMNAGKSSLMNLITQQATSIVDATPGTTADTREALIELHGLGPVKLFDTAGADESSDLGAKKRAKVLNNLKECDLVILVLNPASADFAPEAEPTRHRRIHHLILKAGIQYEQGWIAWHDEALALLGEEGAAAPAASTLSAPPGAPEAR